MTTPSQNKTNTRSSNKTGNNNEEGSRQKSIEIEASGSVAYNDDKDNRGASQDKQVEPKQNTDDDPKKMLTWTLRQLSNRTRYAKIMKCPTEKHRGCALQITREGGDMITGFRCVNAKNPCEFSVADLDAKWLGTEQTELVDAEPESNTFGNNQTELQGFLTTLVHRVDSVREAMETRFVMYDQTQKELVKKIIEQKLEADGNGMESTKTNTIPARVNLEKSYRTPTNGQRLPGQYSDTYISPNYRGKFPRSYKAPHPYRREPEAHPRRGTDTWTPRMGFAPQRPPSPRKREEPKERDMFVRIREEVKKAQREMMDTIASEVKKHLKEGLVVKTTKKNEPEEVPGPNSNTVATTQPHVLHGIPRYPYPQPIRR